MLTELITWNNFSNSLFTVQYQYKFSTVLNVNESFICLYIYGYVDAVPCVLPSVLPTNLPRTRREERREAARSRVLHRRVRCFAAAGLTSRVLQFQLVPAVCWRPARLPDWDDRSIGSCRRSFWCGTYTVSSVLISDLLDFWQFWASIMYSTLHSLYYADKSQQ